MIFGIKIIETRQKIEYIRADSLEEAIESVDSNYCDEKITLKDSDVVDVKFEEY